MTNYIRKCSLDLLAYYYSNVELEDEFSDILHLLQSPKSIEILVKLAKNEVLMDILRQVDEVIKSRLVYKEENNLDTIFEGVVNEEVASVFLYRLVELA